MPIVAWFLVIALSVTAFAGAVAAQGAATGGTKDTGSPTMVFPIRPRDEPPTLTAVPNRSHHRMHYSTGRSVLIFQHRAHRR